MHTPDSVNVRSKKRRRKKKEFDSGLTINKDKTQTNSITGSRKTDY